MSRKKFYGMVTIVVLLGIIVLFRSSKDFSYLNKPDPEVLEQQEIIKTDNHKKNNKTIEEIKNTNVTTDDLSSLVAETAIETKRSISEVKQQNDKTDPFNKKENNTDIYTMSTKFYYREVKVESVLSANSFLASIDGEEKIVRLIGIKDNDDPSYLEQLLFSVDTVFIEFDLQRYNESEEALCYVWLDKPNKNNLNMMVNGILLETNVSELERLTAPNIKYNIFFTKIYKPNL